MDVIRPLEWRGSASGGALWLLDQRKLPLEETWVPCRDTAEVAAAIRDMTVRGAPAIGVAAAYGLVCAAREAKGDGPARVQALAEAARRLAETRPTAVNLFWALERGKEAAAVNDDPEAMLAWARSVHDADVEANVRLGRLGAERVPDGARIHTHCNAGALATGGFGTALGVVYAAVQAGKRVHVYCDETRPRLQGAKLTAWELARAGVPYTLICDGMAAALMRQKKVDLSVVGADRIAANGDVANKIGTYSAAVNAHHHGLPFYVAAPASTFDLDLPSGAGIPIEERSEAEVTCDAAGPVVPRGTPVWNPGFDVTPAALVKAIFTERGEVSPVGPEAVRRVVG